MKNDEAFQIHLLSAVSRTFALTIPQLPPRLSRVVGNAYLLCRIADTIEDDRDMSLQQKQEFSDMFVKVVSGTASAELFAEKLQPLLSTTVPDSETALVINTPAVINITHRCNNRQRHALQRCIRIMAEGMTRYQAANVEYGLEDQEDMDNYCYYVAGVVGEMLTEMFCDYSAGIDKHYHALMQLAVSFGQALQMTNILKDLWDDKARNVCWLPDEVLMQYGVDIKSLSADNAGPEFQAALGHLIGVTHSHLKNALAYTLLIPPHETGIRRFCLWATGMAVLTLRNIHNHRDYSSGRQVKISRRRVRSTIAVTNLLTRSNALLKLLYRIYTASLPVTPVQNHSRTSALTD